MTLVETLARTSAPPASGPTSRRQGPIATILTGVAAKRCSYLAEVGINIQMISTSRDQDLGGRRRQIVELPVRVYTTPSSGKGGAAWSSIHTHDTTLP